MDITLERILSLIPKKPDGEFVHGALKEFAERIGLKSGNVISDWMSGRSKSYKRKLYVISEQYDVSVAWLAGETDKKEKPDGQKADGWNPSDLELLDAFRNAPDYKKDAIRDLLGLK